MRENVHKAGTVWVRSVCVCIERVLREWQKSACQREREGRKKCTLLTITELKCWPSLWPSVLVDMNHYDQRNCTHIPSPSAHPPLHIHQEHMGLL